MRRNVQLAAAMVLAAGVAPSRAAACASCGCGDPTLTAMGLELPYQNRLRLAIEERFGGHTAGDSWVDRSFTLRSSLLASWSPTTRLTVAALVPLVSTWLRSGERPWRSATGLGDVELSLRGVVYRDRAFAPRHLLSALAGLKAPTGPRAYQDDGFPVADDSQPGSGSWDPFAGVAWAWFGDPVSVFSSVGYRYTTRGRNGYWRGQSAGGTVGLQFQPFTRAGFSLAADFRFAAHDQVGGIEMPNTGGASIAITPSVVVAPVDRWLIKLAAQVHVVDWWNGVQSESTTVMLSTVVDVN